MKYFSSHAIIRWKNFVLFNEDNPDMGPQLPGGLFNKVELMNIYKIDPKDEASRIKLSKEVLRRELNEEMNMQPSIEEFIGYFPNTSFEGIGDRKSVV